MDATLPGEAAAEAATDAESRADDLLQAKNLSHGFFIHSADEAEYGVNLKVEMGVAHLHHNAATKLDRYSGWCPRAGSQSNRVPAAAVQMRFWWTRAERMRWAGAQANALKAMRVKVSFTPGRVWIVSVTKWPMSWSSAR